MFPSLLPQFENAFFSSKEGGVPVLLSIWWMYKSLVFGDEFSILLSDMHELLLCDSTLNFTDLVLNARMLTKQTERNEIGVQ